MRHAHACSAVAGRRRAWWLITAAAAGIAITAGATQAQDTPSAERQKTPLVEFRLVVDGPVAGSIALPFDGDTLHLAPAVVTDADVVVLRPTLTDRELMLDIQLTTEAGERLAAYTAAHLDRRMALVVDGAVRTAPVIRSRVGSPITAGVLITDAEAAAEAERLVERIRRRWPEAGGA